MNDIENISNERLVRLIENRRRLVEMYREQLGQMREYHNGQRVGDVTQIERIRAKAHSAERDLTRLLDELQQRERATRRAEALEDFESALRRSEQRGERIPREAIERARKEILKNLF